MDIFENGAKEEKKALERKDCGHLNNLRDVILAGGATVRLFIGDHVCSFPITDVRQTEPQPYERDLVFFHLGSNERSENDDMSFEQRALCGEKET